MATGASQLLEEARQIVSSAAERRLPLRLMGGVAVGLRCPSALRPPLAREYKDIDLVGRRSANPQTIALLTELDYRPDEEFNALQGHSRLLFHDQAGRQIVVILDRLVMSHTLDLRDRLTLDRETLTPGDLLLSKLQVVEINERDFKDAAALLHDQPTADERVSEVVADDWGWWRTVTGNLDRLSEWTRAASGSESLGERIRARVSDLRQRIDEQPKSLRWRMRARIGERVRWYELPEEVE